MTLYLKVTLQFGSSEEYPFIAITSRSIGIVVPGRIPPMDQIRSIFKLFLLDSYMTSNIPVCKKKRKIKKLQKNVNVNEQNHQTVKHKILPDRLTYC